MTSTAFQLYGDFLCGTALVESFIARETISALQLEWLGMLGMLGML